MLHNHSSVVLSWTQPTSEEARQNLCAGINLLSGCTNWPRPEKSKGKKRAACAPMALVATAVDLRGEERPQSSLLEEAVYATNALADEPRANAHYIELSKDGVARRETACVLRNNTAALLARALSF
jgi:hypothetical protein